MFLIAFPYGEACFIWLALAKDLQHLRSKFKDPYSVYIDSMCSRARMDNLPL